MRLRLAELIAALSLATDLGLGMPQEHVLRQCRIALGLADRVGVDDAERAAVYYTAMLAWVGCTADSYELAAQFGDEIEFRAAAHEVDLAGLPMMGFLLGRVGTGRPPLRRARMAAKVVTTQGRVAAEAMTAHCQVASQIARRLGLGPEVQEPLVHVFARWDGSGIPGRDRRRGAAAGDQAGPDRRDRRGPPPQRRCRRRGRGRARARRQPVRPAPGGGVRRLRRASCSTGLPRSRAGTR